MKKKKSCETENDELRVLGVRSQGFGQLPRAVMVDRTLSLSAKGIAAYFYSYTGVGSTCAFPSRSKILRDLNISKDVYYVCLHELVDQGYLVVERKKLRSERGFGHNVYTLVNYPKKYMKLSGESEYLREMLALIQEEEDLSAGGYGNVPKLVMVDPALSLKAKALYALLCTFSGESAVALPEQKTMLYYASLSEATYTRRMRELEKAGLILRTARRVGGKFSGTEVRLCSTVYRGIKSEDISGLRPYRQNQDKQELPDEQFPDMQKQDEQSEREPLFPDIQNSDEYTPDVQNQDTINNKQETRTNSNNNKFHHSLNVCEGENLAINEESEGELTEEELLEETLREGTIPYSWCFHPGRLEKGLRLLTNAQGYTDRSEDIADRQLYLLFIDSLCNMLRADTPHVKIKGGLLTYAKVYERLAPLTLTGRNEWGEPYAELPFLFDGVSARYKAQRAKTPIHSAERYLPAVIWTEITSEELETADQIAYNLAQRA